MQVSATHQQMEVMDNMITKIINTATKKVEGMKRNAPYSDEKEM